MLYLQDAALALLETCGSCMKGWCALRAWRNPRSHDVTSKNDNNLRIAQVWNLHPRTLTAGTWEYTTGSSETHLPNHPFSGSMLIFRGCSISGLFCFCAHFRFPHVFYQKSLDVIWIYIYKIHNLCSFAVSSTFSQMRYLLKGTSASRLIMKQIHDAIPLPTDFWMRIPLHLPHSIFNGNLLNKHLWNTVDGSEIWRLVTSWGKGSWNLPLFTTGVSTIPNRWLVGLGDFWRMKKPTTNRWIPAYPLPLRVARQFEWSWICHRWVKSWGCSIPMSRDGFS